MYVLSRCSWFNFWRPHASLLSEILQARMQEWAAVLLLQGTLHPGIKPMPLLSPAWAGGFFSTSGLAWDETLPLIAEATDCRLSFSLPFWHSFQLLDFINILLWGRIAITSIECFYILISFGRTQHLIILTESLLMRQTHLLKLKMLDAWFSSLLWTSLSSRYRLCQRWFCLTQISAVGCLWSKDVGNVRWVHPAGMPMVVTVSSVPAVSL